MILLIQVMHDLFLILVLLYLMFLHDINKLIMIDYLIPIMLIKLDEIFDPHMMNIIMFQMNLHINLLWDLQLNKLYNIYLFFRKIKNENYLDEPENV
jgi:hypothetical protein